MRGTRVTTKPRPGAKRQPGGIGNAGAGNGVINGSVIEGNFTGGTGGGFGDAANTGSLMVNNSFFLGNTAAGNGGGIQQVWQTAAPIPAPFLLP